MAHVQRQLGLELGHLFPFKFAANQLSDLGDGPQAIWFESRHSVRRRSCRGLAIKSLAARAQLARVLLCWVWVTYVVFGGGANVRLAGPSWFHRTVCLAWADKLTIAQEEWAIWAAHVNPTRIQVSPSFRSSLVAY